MCRISSRYPFAPLPPDPKSKPNHPRRAAAFFHMSLPTLVPFRATTQGQVTVAPFSTRPPEQRGHDPSLGAPMPGHHRALARTVGPRPSALRTPVTGSQTPNCSLPSLSPRAVQAVMAFALCCARSSNNVSVCDQPRSPSSQWSDVLYFASRQ